MKTTIRGRLVAQHGNDWTQDKEEKQTTQKIRKTKYKCKKYLLRSKYMTPSNGVKVDGHIPSSTNARQLLSCLLLRRGKVMKNHNFDLHPDYIVLVSKRFLA